MDKFQREKRKWRKRRDQFIIKVFVVGVGVLGAIGLMLPLRPKVSELEKRTLESFPTFRLQGIWDGSYFNQISTWYADSFPGREWMLSANGAIQQMYGIQKTQLHGSIQKADEIPVVTEKKESAENKPEETTPEETTVPETTPAPTLPDGTIKDTPVEAAGTVYIAGNRAFELYYFNQKGAEAYASAVNLAAEKLNGISKVYDIVVPTSCGIMLDDAALSKLGGSPQKPVTDYVHGLLSDKVTKVPVFDTLKQHNAEYLYFRTDHHWTALGAYYAYVEFANSKGVSANPLESFEKKQFDGFVGSLYSATQAEILKKEPDTVDAYVPMATNSLTYTEKDGSQLQGFVIFDESKAPAGIKYSCFIGGDHPYERIENPNLSDGSSCLVIKESYGNAFVPFLVDHYQTVHVIDYRHYKQNLVEFIKNNQVQDVIFINNMMALSERVAGQITALLG